MSDEISQLKSDIKRLKEENALKTGWISLISHNLKENFSSLLWLIESLENQAISQDDFFNLLPQVKQDTQKNLQSSLDTENWLKTQLEDFELQKSSVYAHDLFLKLQEDFEHKLTNKKINFQFKGSKNLSLQTDRFLIQFVLKRILDNAIKYSQNGKTIQFEVSKQKNKIVLSVIDFGIGMEPNQLDLLFSFPTIITKGTQEEIGAGLGLKIVKNFVFLLLGKIEVDSTKNEGTTVSIILPEK